MPGQGRVCPIRRRTGKWHGPRRSGAAVGRGRHCADGVVGGREQHHDRGFRPGQQYEPHQPTIPTSPPPRFERLFFLRPAPGRTSPLRTPPSRLVKRRPGVPTGSRRDLACTLQNGKRGTLIARNPPKCCGAARTAAYRSRMTTEGPDAGYCTSLPEITLGAWGERTQCTSWGMATHRGASRKQGAGSDASAGVSDQWAPRSEDAWSGGPLERVIGARARRRRSLGQKGCESGCQSDAEAGSSAEMLSLVA